MYRPAFKIALIPLALSFIAPAQSQPAAKPGRSATKATPAPKLDRKKQFVVDVVRTAVALPQPDLQDRLRVLEAAANVVMSIRPALAKQYAREGLRIEQDLIQSGTAPAVSLLQSGHADCANIATFIENIPTARVTAAEQSLVGAISFCGKQALEPARRKLQAGLDEGYVAPRALLAVIDRVGAGSPWAQESLARMFSALPSDPKSVKTEAPNFAAMYAEMGPKVDKAVARSTGIKLLQWLAKADDSGERKLSVNIATGAMKQALGDEAYEEALASDVMVRQIAQQAGQPVEVEHAQEENVSVLKAMEQHSSDRTAELANMSPSLRAREAAASGFAAGTEGNNRKLADRYFDIAFQSLDSVWQNRSSANDAPAVVQEVSEAAAQVDPVEALKRAQRLQDPTAQAIAMIAVARVAANQQEPEKTAKQ